ncbi:DUF1648 domain-containing protein [Candidatus Gracilibacteria bacterium]|nr:DUF1648 domain-containing protein [Candidatus Gracilibacteria bacterium]
MTIPRFAAYTAGLMVILGVLALPFLPEQVPIHWNIAGEVDGHTNRWFGAFFSPLLAAALLALLAWLPQIDPRRASYAQFAGTYRLIMNALVVLFIAVAARDTGLCAGPAAGCDAVDRGRHRLAVCGARQRTRPRNSELFCRLPHTVDVGERASLAAYAPSRRARDGGGGRGEHAR